LSSYLDEIYKLVKSRGYRVEERGDAILVWHPSAPLALRLVVYGDTARLELYAENIRDYLDDLVEQVGEEEARDQLEEVLDDLSEAHALIESVLRKRGVRVESRFKDNVLDVLEAFEDITES